MLLKLRLWIGEKLFGYVGMAGVRVSPKRMVKWQCEEPEVEALRYAAANTSIPMPKLYKVHKMDGKFAIEMEYLADCQTLQQGWRNLSAEQKSGIVNQVAGYIRQLRDIEPPSMYGVSSTEGGRCRDIRIGTVRLFGPYDNSAAFHRCVRGGIRDEDMHKSFDDTTIRVHRREYRSRFTHGDLGVQNILIQNGKVVALLDWECAGWYPDYWEYTKAHYNHVYLPQFYEMLAPAIDRFGEELEAERYLWRWLDQPLDQLDPGTPDWM